MVLNSKQLHAWRVVGVSITEFSADPGEGCGAAGAPARERGTAAARQPGAVRAGRPGLVRRAGAAYTAQALGRSLPRDASDAAGLAPQAGGEQVRQRPPEDTSMGAVPLYAAK